MFDHVAVTEQPTDESIERTATAGSTAIQSSIPNTIHVYSTLEGEKVENSCHPAYAQRISDHSYCVYLKDEFASAHAVELLTCVFTDHGYIVSGVRATDDGVVGSATIASADAPLVASGGLTATAAASAAPAVHFKTGAHPIKGNLMVVEFAGGAKAQKKKFKDSSAVKVLGIVGNVGKIAVVSALGLVSVVAGLAIAGAAASGAPMVLGVAGAALAVESAGKAKDEIKEDFLSAFGGARDKSKPLAYG